MNAVAPPSDIFVQLAALAARGQTFGAIHIDTPNRFMTRSLLGQTKLPRYPTMTFERSAELPIKQVAAPNCMIVSWTTQAMLPQGLELLKAWGFDFRSSGTWAKLSKTGKKWAFGTGYILRNSAEYYLIVVRGKPKQRVRNIRNLIVAKVREHSRKPEQIYEDIEAMFPDTNKLDIFGRASRPGWTIIGDQPTLFDPLTKESAA